jgi:methylamine dehydrogenase accessory protein MauD
MLNGLLVSNLLLWIVVLATVAVMFALVRQIGVLYERVAPAGALVLGNGPKVGEAAPILNLRDLNGELHQVGGESPNARSRLLFFLSPTCPVCKTLLPVLKSISNREKKWLNILLSSDGERKEHESFVRDYRLEKFPYFLSTELGLGYRVGRLPHAVLIDETGVIRSTGLVNSREHIESLFEASERGVASLQEFMALTQSEDLDEKEIA